MKSTMMRVELSINHFLERAGTYFGDREVISKMGGGSIHRTNYSAVRTRARQLALALALREKAGLKRGDALPRTATGKVMKFRLRDQFKDFVSSAA